MDEQNLSNQTSGQPFNPPMPNQEPLGAPLTTTTTTTPDSTTTTTITPTSPTTPEIQWPEKKPKNKFKQIALGMIALLLVVGVAGAAYYVSNQLASRGGIALTGPLQPFAAGGCTNNPSQCKAGKEKCVNGVCKPIAPTPTGYGTGYTCTSSNCPGPCFSCNATKTSCIGHPEVSGCGGVQATGTPAKTPTPSTAKKLCNSIGNNLQCSFGAESGGTQCYSSSTSTTPQYCCSPGVPLLSGKCFTGTATAAPPPAESCEADQKFIGGVCRNTICGNDSGCTSPDRCIGGTCVQTPSGTCEYGKDTKTVSCTTPLSSTPNNSSLPGTMKLTCCLNGTYDGCNARAVCVANPSKSTCPAGVDCNLPAGTAGASTCNNSVGTPTLCCSTANPEYSATSKACKPAGGYTDVCSPGLCCSTTYTSGAFTCKSTATATTQDRFCCHQGEAISGGKCVVSTSGCGGGSTGGGGVTATPTKGGGGGCTVSSWTPNANTVCTTATVNQTSNCGTKRTVPGTKVCVVANPGACMEISLFSQKTDGTFNTTPMTLDQRNKIKINDKIRLAVRSNNANLRAKFRITQGTSSTVEVVASGLLNTTTKLTSYYDYTISKTGTYKFEAYVSTAPSTASIQTTCAGVAGIKCPTGFECKVSSKTPDALGVCVATAN